MFERLRKKQDLTWTQQQLAGKLLKWKESCWKMVVYTIFSVTAFLVTFRCGGVLGCTPWNLSKRGVLLGVQDSSSAGVM